MYSGQNVPETFELHEVEDEIVMRKLLNLKVGKPAALDNNYSTTTITSSFLDDIYMNDQRIVNAIFINFCKAFDSINHKLILLKL